MRRSLPINRCKEPSFHPLRLNYVNLISEMSQRPRIRITESFRTGGGHSARYACAGSLNELFNLVLHPQLFAYHPVILSKVWCADFYTIFQLSHTRELKSFSIISQFFIFNVLIYKAKYPIHFLNHPLNLPSHLQRFLNMLPSSLCSCTRLK